MLRLRLLAVATVVSLSGTYLRAEQSPKPLLIHTEEATKAFARMFRETCFEHKGSLLSLRSAADRAGWQVVAGKFPRREEQLTTEIAWNAWDEDAPYLLSLETHDDTKPALTCSLSAPFLMKSKLVDIVQQATGLRVRRIYQDAHHRTTLLETENDPDLRVACVMSVSEDIYDGQCSLVRPVPAHSQVDHHGISRLSEANLNGQRAPGAS